MCRNDSVRVDMGIFVKKYLPERWPQYQESLKQEIVESGSEDEDDVDAPSKRFARVRWLVVMVKKIIIVISGS